MTLVPRLRRLEKMVPATKPGAANMIFHWVDEAGQQQRLVFFDDDSYEFTFEPVTGCYKCFLGFDPGQVIPDLFDDKIDRAKPK